LNCIAETDYILQAWEELWLDVVPGTEAGLRLYISDIVPYLQRAITSPSWKLKAQAASSIDFIATSLKDQLEVAQRDVLLRILLDALSGRTWDGKEHLLHALASLCHIQQAHPTPYKDEIIVVVLREAKKETLPYRRHAVQVLGLVVDDFRVDLFQPVFEMLQPLFQRPGDDDSDAEDMEEEGHQAKTLELHEAAIMALGRAFPLDETTQSKMNQLIGIVLSGLCSSD